MRWRARLPVGRPRGGMKSETEHGSWNTWRTYSNNGERWLSSVSTASPRHQHRWATDAMRTGRGGAGSHAADGSTDHRVADRGRYVNILLRCGRSAERKGTACRATCHTASSHLVVHVSDCNHESRTRNGGSAQARGHQRERAPSWNLSGSCRLKSSFSDGAARAAAAQMPAPAAAAPAASQTSHSSRSQSPKTCLCGRGWSGVIRGMASSGAPR